MKQTKIINFWDATIKCIVTDTVPETFNPKAIAGVCIDSKEDSTFIIWFKGTVTIPTLVHECWHLFCDIMSYADEHEHSFEELSGEIYAYSFTDLVKKVLETTRSMKLYYKFCEEREKMNEDKTNWM